MMGLQLDSRRGREAGALLRKAFVTPGVGIFERTRMPEDVLPGGVKAGSLEHLLFITLTVAIDYQRDAVELWHAGRQTYADKTTRHLYDPPAVYEARNRLVKDLQKHGLSRKPKRDAWIWATVTTTFLKKWGGDPRRFLMAYGYDAPTVRDHLVEDTHPQRGKEVADFPYLRGPKIAPLWLRMLRDNVKIELGRMADIPIPVDVHIARATAALGVIRGAASVRFADVRPIIQAAWRDVAAGTPHIALDFDEPLWHLSKFGCTDRRDTGCPHFDGCPVASYCIPGVVRVSADHVEMNT
jgi:hypothetical protein